MHSSLFHVTCFLACLVYPQLMLRLNAAELAVIAPGSEPVIAGKELDWIYGDYLLKNDQISLVIANPLATRDANMTVRNIGASILDLTLNQPSNDQLSSYTPTAGRYLFQNTSLIESGLDANSVYWKCQSSKTLAKDGTTATVEYRLTEGDAYVVATVSINGDKAPELKPFDGVRADGWFVFDDANTSSGNVAYCEDAFFRQTIGFKVTGSTDSPTWKKGRPSKLQYTDAMVERTDRSLSWTVQIYPATSPTDLITAVQQSMPSPGMVTFNVAPNRPPSEEFDWINRAKVTLRPLDEAGEDRRGAVTLQTDDHGVAHARLIPGKYLATASAIGYAAGEVKFRVTRHNRQVTLPMTDASGFEVTVTDGQGNFIPFKASIYSPDQDPPNFGLSSARTFVENLAYSVHGRLRCPLAPGTYEVIFSHGPEYNSEKRSITISTAKIETLSVQLTRGVDTTGWVSADLHSHSSPSGDNTSDQYGRVENLLCENIEFAPCTEHNRISSYVPHLNQMKLNHLLATCTGIELTGSPTPINHQNAFPLHRHPHTQNGGGPRASSNPVTQIERLALWDNASEKVVQMNHPNLHRIYGDLDADGIPDDGFRGMLEWADVVEVHPLETIFQDVANNPPSVRRMRIPLFQWMQLLNQGHRIPGVINTDSHYNHHGSGWRRNWFVSSTDDPAEISTDEMVREIQAGHIIMSTGPFLSVLAQSPSATDTVIPGDDLVATDRHVTLNVKVQCPNWLDVNRVQVFINGRPSDDHNYTRKNSPKLFGDIDSVVKFDSSIDVALSGDAHLIVATIGEGMTMEKVMGRRYGKRPPIAVSNPIFVDVNQNGFEPNGDQLGLPLPSASMPQESP